jgi:hypothetical protein
VLESLKPSFEGIAEKRKKMSRKICVRTTILLTENGRIMYRFLRPLSRKRPWDKEESSMMLIFVMNGPGKNAKAWQRLWLIWNLRTETEVVCIEKAGNVKSAYKKQEAIIN